VTPVHPHITSAASHTIFPDWDFGNFSAALAGDKLRLLPLPFWVGAGDTVRGVATSVAWIDDVDAEYISVVGAVNVTVAGACDVSRGVVGVVIIVGAIIVVVVDPDDDESPLLRGVDWRVKELELELEIEFVESRGVETGEV